MDDPASPGSRLSGSVNLACPKTAAMASPSVFMLK
jgi:hypothetical protein